MKMKLIKMGTLSLLLVLAITAFNYPTAPADTLPPNDADVNACFMENNTFQAGEQIIYKIYYNWNFVWIPAGEAVFNVTEENNEYHLSAVGTTYDSYNWFFKVKDIYDSYINKETLLPSTSIRDVSEGNYQLYDKVNFDQENKKAVSLRGKTKDKTVRREYETGDCMHDILSIIYYTRNLDFDNLTPGAEFPIKIFMDKEVWPLNVKYKGKEANKKIKGMGKYNTIKFSPEVIAGTVFNDGAEMNIWASDDENRIPLMIESAVSVGSVKVVLKEYKGLKYDFTAKVK